MHVMENQYCIGIDFGTDSVRSIIVDARNGQEIASAIYHYPRWRDGLYCNASINQFRQHPQDYIDGLEDTVRRCLHEAGPSVRANIRAISVDTTGSTPVAVDQTGTPLALRPGFADDPDAMFILWKDHTSVKEAAAINAHANKVNVDGNKLNADAKKANADTKKAGTDYLKYVGGIYSSEWYWSKLLHILRKNERVNKDCHSFVEHCDWIPFLLTGGQDVGVMKRSVCTAGHKALWAEDWGGFPPESFFTSLDPLLARVASGLPGPAYTADKPAGRLSVAWAARLGLSPDVLVGIGAMDAHMGAVGGQIEPYFLSKVMGTSTCDMLVAPVSEMKGKYVRGICGLVNGSIIPGMIGMEAGQSAFGDVYAWFRNLLAWPLKHILADKHAVEETVEKIIPELSRHAAQLYPEENSELSIDWFNGRRTPDANALLKGCITGLSLGSDAPKIFRSLVESTCFGAKAIVDRFEEQGVPVKGLIGIGGVARKSPFIMQMLADVMNMPIKINRSEQTCALGAAMFAATAAGIYPRVEDAMDAMGHGFDAEYHPESGRAAVYARRYMDYQAIGNFIGKQYE
jgi:L-ribulokinase